MASPTPSMFSLAGEVAIVTGGTRGIGEAMTLALAEAGADIIFIQRSTEFHPIHAAITKLGRRFDVFSADLSQKDEVRGIIPAILSQNLKPTILLNNAGIQRRNPAENFTDEDWDEVLQVNLSTIFTLSRDFGKHLLEQPADANGHRGCIISIASLMSYQGGLNIPAYAASKGGVAQLTKALSNDWAGKGIRVNAVAPGYVATDLNRELQKGEANEYIVGRVPMGRWGNGEDFKGVAVWLASRRASGFVTGEVVTVDGGWMGR